MLRKGLILCFFLVALSPSGFADVLEYSWNACPNEGGTLDVTLPCSEPDGSVRLYLSFVLTIP